jgi:Zn-dependent protease
MRLPDPSVRLFGIDLHVHWSCLLVAPFVFGQGAYAVNWQVGLLNVAVLAAFVLGLMLHELLQALFANRFGIRTRDIYLYPVCGFSRLASIGERPRRELWISLVGIGLGILFASGLTLIMKLNHWGYDPARPESEPSLEVFFNRLFWCQILFAIANLLPTFPFDGAYAFRSALALTATRMRATEVATTLGTLIALALILLDLFLVHNGLLGTLAVFVFVMSQYELVFMKYFFEMHHPQANDRSKQIGSIPTEQLIDPETRPIDPNFTGFIWNFRTRMWIEWRDGQPVSASAILGE